MPLASSLLRDGALYTRQQLGDLFGYGAKARETGILAPRKYASVLLFITKRRTATTTGNTDDLQGDDLYFDSQTGGRVEAKLIHQEKLGLEILLFCLEHPNQHSGDGFRYEGRFDYVAHTPGKPHRFHLRRGGGAAASPLESREVKRYALLANFHSYDVEGASRAVVDATWLLPFGDVAPGDLLLFWRTLGPDGKRGVVALGEVTHAPAMLEDEAASGRFWRTSPPSGPQRRLRLRYLRVPGLPLWLGEDQSGLLGQLTVSRAQGNKLYAVPAALWTAIVALAGAAAPEVGREQKLGATWGEGPATQVMEALTAPGAMPSRDDEPPPLPLNEPDAVSAVQSVPTEEAVARVLKHLRTHGSLTEAEVTLMAGGARGYRRLRRRFEGHGTHLLLEPTAQGMLWRLAKEHG